MGFSTVTFNVPGGAPVGDHWISIRDVGRIRIEPGNIQLSERSSAIDRTSLKAGDWLVGVITPQLDPDLNRIAEHFPQRFRWFETVNRSMTRDGMQGALLWIADLRGLPSHHDAYNEGNNVLQTLAPIYKALDHRFQESRLTYEVAKLSLTPLEAYEFANLVGSYSPRVPLRSLPAEAKAAMERAPQSKDYTNPTWAEYIQEKLNKGDPEFLKIVPHLGARDYKDLYVVKETLLLHYGKDQNAGAKEIISRGWTTEAELESFWKTAHNYRHSEQRPLDVPAMHPTVADHLMRRLFHYYIVDRMRADGLVK